MARRQAMHEDLPIGQMFLVGFRGCELQADHWLANAIGRDRLGGVILFDRNVDGSVQNIRSPQQLRHLVSWLQDQAEMPLFIGIDQEGGSVCRLKQRDGFCGTTSAASLSRQGVTAVAGEAEATAAQLAACGINLNFSPVVDLELNPDGPAIGRHGRSYGTDPVQVAACAQVVIEAHHRHGVGCCLKHFPGHGSAGGDSHLGFVDVTDCWQAIELEPYQMLIGAGYRDGVMTAHLVSRRLDDSGLPATLSPTVITDLLRRRLGFDGVVFSDDLQMRAIRDGWSYAEAVQRAVLAGVDVLVVGNNLIDDPLAVRQGIRAVRELLENDRIEPGRIRGSLARIAQFKHTIEEQAWNTLVPPTTG